MKEATDATTTRFGSSMRQAVLDHAGPALAGEIYNGKSEMGL